MISCTNHEVKHELWELNYDKGNTAQDIRVLAYSTCVLTRRVQRATLPDIHLPPSTLSRQIPPVRSYVQFNIYITCGSALGVPDYTGGHGKRGKEKLP